MGFVNLLLLFVALVLSVIWLGWEKKSLKCLIPTVPCVWLILWIAKIVIIWSVSATIRLIVFAVLISLIIIVISAKKKEVH